MGDSPSCRGVCSALVGISEGKKAFWSRGGRFYVTELTQEAMCCWLTLFCPFWSLEDKSVYLYKMICENP